ncbi:MAG TPA: hypothetical protein VK151_08665 [Fluviicola sp.]|nr:hypothetical protein [Fluviicola sp.]
MKKYLETYSIYLRSTYRVSRPLQKMFFVVCIFFSSSVTSLVEVFTRKDFGVRHFLLGAALRLAFVLAVVPILPFLFQKFILSMFLSTTVATTGNDMVGGQLQEAIDGMGMDFTPYILWYLFLGAFVVMSFRHWDDIRRRPPMFEKPRHTLYGGLPHKWFFNLKLPGFGSGIKAVECWYEPAVFFIPGLFLYLIGQHLGLLMMVTAVMYSGYSFSAYWLGQEAVMNTYDEMVDRKWSEKLADIKWFPQGENPDLPDFDTPINEDEFRKMLASSGMSKMPSFQAKIPH